MHAWPRQEHYRYFGELDDPYFGITAKADFTSCYMQSKQDGASFFLYSLHKILRAANAIDEFRYRVEDGSFDFGVFEYHEDRLMMSVSVELNHGLADGYHVAQFFRLLNML